MADFATKAENLRMKAADRAFTLATATLALSVTFRNSITSGHPVGLGFLSVAWIALIVSICSYILGLLAESLVNVELAEKLPPAGKHSRKHILLILIPTIFTWGGLGTGMTCLAIFALMNNGV